MAPGGAEVMGPPLAWTLWVDLRCSGSHLPTPSGPSSPLRFPYAPPGGQTGGCQDRVGGIGEPR